MLPTMGISWYDSHCHLDFPQLDAVREAEMHRCRTWGMAGLVVPGVAAGQFQRQQAVVERYGLYAGWGLHPWYRAETGELERLERQLHHPATVALGECGLDRLRGGPMDAQLTRLEAQLELARQHDVPVILHVVRAHEPLLACLRRQPGIRGVVHGFRGSTELADRYLNLGLYLGIGPAFLWPRQHKWRQSLMQLPRERLLLETDAPASPPPWLSGQPNRPSVLPRVALELARLRGEPAETLTQALADNTRCLFSMEDAP